jgi:hypothetical protein
VKNEERLTETFGSHEDQTPDPAAVYARVEELSRSYKWRRRGVQVAGGVVVAAGLITGFVKLPGLLPGDPAASQPAGNNAIVAAAPATPVTDEAALKEYFAKGYGYDDAVRFAKLWHSTADIAAVKADAGRKLVAGVGLPYPPLPRAPEPSPDSPEVKLAQKQLAAFFDAGYQWDDAEKLAKLWHIKDPSDAKIAAGKKLLAHQSLPVKPKPANVAAALENKRVEAFFKKGYDIDDAQKLATLWHKSTFQAKVEAGKRLLAGEQLPVQP